MSLQSFSSNSSCKKQILIYKLGIPLLYALGIWASLMIMIIHASHYELNKGIFPGYASFPPRLIKVNSKPIITFGCFATLYPLG